MRRAERKAARELRRIERRRAKQVRRLVPQHASVKLLDGKAAALREYLNEAGVRA